MEDIKVSLTGMSGEIDSAKDIVNEEINRNIQRWSKFSRINSVNIDVRRHEKGGRVKYSVKIEATGQGSFHSDAHDWNLENAMHESLDKLGKELLKKKEKVEGL